MEKWKEIQSTRIITSPWTTVDQKKYRLPNGYLMDPWYIIGRDDYVLILAETADHKFVIERQYRPATDSFYYEIPAGSIEKGETPEQATIRELREEAGYVASDIKIIAKTSPLPGLVKCWAYIAHVKIKSKKTTKLDVSEDIETILLDRAEIDKLITSGTIFDIGALAAFYALGR